MRSKPEGLEVYEALAIFEVLTLAEQHPISSIVITPDIDQARAEVIAQHDPKGAPAQAVRRPADLSQLNA